MVLNAFPCNSQHFMFLLDKDFAADIMNHMIFLWNREKRDNGTLGRKIGLSQCLNLFYISLTQL
jgi:hypothetical protein